MTKARGRAVCIGDEKKRESGLRHGPNQDGAVPKKRAATGSFFFGVNMKFPAVHPDFTIYDYESQVHLTCNFA